MIDGPHMAGFSPEISRNILRPAAACSNLRCALWTRAAWAVQLQSMSTMRTVVCLLFASSVAFCGCTEESPFADPGCDDFSLPVATFVYIGLFDAEDEPLCVTDASVTVFQGTEGPVPMMRSDSISGRLVRDENGKARLQQIGEAGGCNLFVVPSGPAPGRDTTWAFERCAEPIDYSVSVPG